MTVLLKKDFGKNKPQMDRMNGNERGIKLCKHNDFLGSIYVLHLRVSCLSAVKKLLS